ncbi:asparagine synthase (glutamine-hydrolyzing) [Ruegeria faecimaris]|uniref:asparagine synthase (glutamine-hydrolyzing) n=1 Tax=Ruegeria faecimaris TaxID=686389 RepID=UPI00248FC8D1|nr:asparagine synthase (glutamine-hydrolyzing) [Ruegeria faecimaris]
MCGITGFINFGTVDRSQASSVLGRMCQSIEHRGPDGTGLFVDPDQGVALGHLRLAIIDLSETGVQPMDSADGRFTIVFNGEIYGYLELRQELQDLGISFRGTSDTEVLLAAMQLWGIRKTLDRVHGMFAIAVFDRKTQSVTLARDRIGKKPLYLGLAGKTVLFGSELKSLRAHPEFGPAEVDRAALGSFLRLGYIPAPRTIYPNVLKLPAGSMVEIKLDTPPASLDALLQGIERFWDIEAVVTEARANPYPDDETAIAEIESELLRAVGERMVADVPVGTFLSGGVDSSLITAMMQEQSSRKVPSFTVRFEDEDTNEADHAKAIAEYLGTDYHEVTATPEMAFQAIEGLPQVFDEPFADPSQLPTLLVSQLARQQLKVVVSGDGGDESFGGYARYVRMQAFERLKGKMPDLAIQALSQAPQSVLAALVPVLRPFAPRSMRDDLSADRLAKLAPVLQGREFQCRYQAQFSIWSSGMLGKSGIPLGNEIGTHDLPAGLSQLDSMMLLDSLYYLPDDILVKADRTSMSVGLEMRAPLLDYRVVTAAWRSSSSLRCDGKVGKVALQELLKKRVPQSLYDRPKRGFGIPLNAWLRGPLKSRVSSILLDGNGLEGFVDKAALEKCWAEHQSGKRNWGAQLWTVFMFQLWSEAWMR